MCRGIFVAIAPKDNFLLEKCQHLMARKVMKINRPSTLDIVNQLMFTHCQVDAKCPPCCLNHCPVDLTHNS